MSAVFTGVMSTANPCGGSHSTLLQKQMSFKSSVGANQLSKADDIEVMENGHNDASSARFKKNSTLSWICCAPCTWLRTSTAIHKIAITTATLLVTSLLVASPILFLISTAPSQLPRDCYNEDDKCMPTPAPPPECVDPICRIVAHNIHTRINWNFDPCASFKNFSCPSDAHVTGLYSLHTIRSAQETVDLQMQP